MREDGRVIEGVAGCGRSQRGRPERHPLPPPSSSRRSRGTSPCLRLASSNLQPSLVIQVQYKRLRTSGYVMLRWLALDINS